MIKEKTINVLSIEIPLHEKGIERMDEIFSRYKTVENLPKTVKDPTIHLYMKEDTYNENGDLNGYGDSLMFECHIYDKQDRLKYVSKRLHDNIRFGNIEVISGFFKDGSITYTLYGEYHFDMYQGIRVSKCVGQGEDKY